MVTALIYCAVIYIIGLLSARLMRVDGLTLAQILGSGTFLDNPDAVVRWYISVRPGVLAYIIDLLLNFMTWLLYAGFVVFVLRMIRQQRNSLWNLMDGFQNFLKIIGLNILTGIFVALWSLLFVIPGIIAAYRYRQALYLLLDHPEMGVLECIRESKRLMRGHKAELFILDLSFIGWALLSIIPFVSVYTLPYTESTYALYYSMLREQDAGPRPRPRSRPRSLVQQLKRRKKTPAVRRVLFLSGLRPGSGGGLHEADQDGRAHGAVGAAGGVEGGVGHAVHELGVGAVIHSGGGPGGDGLGVGVGELGSVTSAAP